MMDLRVQGFTFAGATLITLRLGVELLRFLLRVGSVVWSL